jgi:hypothetical protein
MLAAYVSMFGMLASRSFAQVAQCEAVVLRRDCGKIGTTEKECLAGSCCWAPVDPNPHNKPWCFHQHPLAPTPAPRPPPSPSPSAGTTVKASSLQVDIFVQSYDCRKLINHQPGSLSRYSTTWYRFHAISSRKRNGSLMGSWFRDGAH